MKNKWHIGWKSFWEKEKLLVTSNFSFSYNAFHRYIYLVCQNVWQCALCGSGLIYSHSTWNLMTLKENESFENIAGKNDGNVSHFLLFPKYYLSISVGESCLSHCLIASKFDQSKLYAYLKGNLLSRPSTYFHCRLVKTRACLGKG